MTSRSWAVTIGLAVLCAGLLGQVYHQHVVIGLERRITEAEQRTRDVQAESESFQHALFRQTAETLQRDAEASGLAMMQREDSYARLDTAAADAHIAITPSQTPEPVCPSKKGVDLDALLPVAATNPVIRVLCEAVRANDCSGDDCIDTASGKLCAQAASGVQIRLTVRELLTAFIRWGKWAGEAGADRRATGTWIEMMEGADMGKSE